MADPVKRKATYADLEALPEPLVGELIAGDLYASPRPSPRHTRGESALQTILGQAYDFGVGGPGGWWILVEPELRLGPDTLVPDLAGWRRERMPAIPDAPAFVVPPDWVCEVVSPSTERLDRVRKLPVYHREEVAHVWLLNPLTRTLEVLKRAEPGWQLVAMYDGTAPVRAEPFDAIELDLSRLWGAASVAEPSPGG